MTPPSTIPAIAASVSQYRRTRRSTAEVGYVIRAAPRIFPAEAIGTAT